MSLLMLSLLLAAPPTNLLRQDGFDLGTAPARYLAEPRPTLRVEGAGGCAQEVLPAVLGPFSLAVDVRTQEVRPTGPAGYAFVAVYELDGFGEMVAFRDAVQLAGTNDWRRVEVTFTPHPAARILSVRGGLYSAEGTAEFADWTLVPGTRPLPIDAVRPRGLKRRPTGVAALLAEPSLAGGGSSPAVIAAVVERAGLRCERLSAEELGDAERLVVDRYDVVVLPATERFPAAAAEPLRRFLHEGGSLVSLGGYPFQALLERRDGTWIPAEEAAREESERAVAEGRTPLADGSFETIDSLPREPDPGRWWATTDGARVVGENPRRGRRCVRIEVPEGETGGEIVRDIPAEVGAFEASGWLKIDRFAGAGHAFLAVYQYDADDNLLDWRDYAVVRQQGDWTRFVYPFVTRVGATRLRLRAGLYNATGTVYVDDLRLVASRGRPVPLNSATGKPDDGLILSPLQIGLGDPSCPLRRVARLRTAADQSVLAREITIDGPVDGWQMVGVLGEQARWIPLLAGVDRYGRSRGAAMAMVVWDGGFWDGSTWIGCGVRSPDLFGAPDSPAAEALVAGLRFIQRGVSLKTVTTAPRYARAGEPVRIHAELRRRWENSPPVDVAIGFEAAGEDRRTAAGGETSVAVDRPAPDSAVGPARLDVHLVLDGERIDSLAGGVVIDRPELVRGAPALRFVGNQFTLAGRPLFLFGTDTYAYTYLSRHESPLTWAAEHRGGRDIGLDLYENLQYTPPSEGFGEAVWRDFRGMGQLTQQHGLVFMPGALVGLNVAIDDETLAAQSALAAEYARRLGDLPALLYYLNGDYQMRPERSPEAVAALWRDWLHDRYGDAAGVAARWGEGRGLGDDGRYPAPPPTSGRWDDPARIDWSEFLGSLTRRWNEAHVAAVRAVDGEHPITSEYYQFPFDGIDLRLTIADQDVSNIGYFDEPGRDLDLLPMRLAWNDLRARGKGVSLGEYGVKTHPAWAVENGGGHYHITRTEAQQQALFEAVAGYTLAYGGAKIQNWCLVDAQQRCFPWGLFYPHRMVPKDVAYVHRNLSLMFRFLEPRDLKPAVTVCLPSRLRLGNHEALGWQTGYRAFDSLMRLRVAFDVIDDVEPIPAGTRAMLLPSARALDDAAFDRLRAWVNAGGRLLVTGDITRDADRQPTREDRLTRLCGVRLVERLGLEHRPALRVEPAGATWVEPLHRFKLGAGEVLYTPDPIEQADEAAPERESIYRLWLAGIDVGPTYPDWLPGGGDRLARPTRTGTVFLAGEDRRACRFSLIHQADDGSVRWLLHTGELTTPAGKLVGGDARVGLLALDGRPLTASEAMLVLPFSTGQVQLPRDGAWRWVIGETVDGVWTTYETIDGDARLALDEDRRTALALLVRPGGEQAAIDAVTRRMTRPWELPGF